MEPFAAKLSQKKVRALFHNADNDETNRLFSGLTLAEVPKSLEVREEAKQVDPYEFINERNEALNKARLEAALINDSAQTMIKGPTRSGITEEIDMDQLIPLVRQAAQNALLKRPKLIKK